MHGGQGIIRWEDFSWQSRKSFLLDELMDQAQFTLEKQEGLVWKNNHVEMNRDSSIDRTTCVTKELLIT